MDVYVFLFVSLWILSSIFVGFFVTIEWLLRIEARKPISLLLLLGSIYSFPVVIPCLLCMWVGPRIEKVATRLHRRLDSITVYEFKSDE